jgi:hypothetical protein
LFAALTSALAAISLTTTSRCPFWEAMMRAVEPSCSVRHSVCVKEQKEVAVSVSCCESLNFQTAGDGGRAEHIECRWGMEGEEREGVSDCVLQGE